MREQLHSEIDALEDLRERARVITEKVIRDNLRTVLDQTHDIGAAMVLLAKIVENELTELTTEAFRSGVGFAQTRAKS